MTSALHRVASHPAGMASGAIIHVMQVLLGIRADAPAGLLTVDAALPD